MAMEGNQNESAVYFARRGRRRCGGLIFAPRRNVKRQEEENEGSARHGKSPGIFCSKGSLEIATKSYVK